MVAHEAVHRERALRPNRQTMALANTPFPRRGAQRDTVLKTCLAQPNFHSKICRPDDDTSLAAHRSQSLKLKPDKASRDMAWTLLYTASQP